MGDAFYDEAFCRELVRAIQKGHAELADGRAASWCSSRRRRSRKLGIDLDAHAGRAAPARS